VSSNIPIQIGSSPMVIKGARLFMSGHTQFLDQQIASVTLDDEWKEKVLLIPLSRQVDPFGKSLAISEDIYKKLVEDTSGIIGWAMAVPDECLMEITKTATPLNGVLDTFLDEYFIDWFALQFFVFKVRLDPSKAVIACHSGVEKPESLTYAFRQFVEDRGKFIPKGRFVVQKALKKALRTLNLTDKVKVIRRYPGLVYKGITLSTDSGKPIESSSPKVITLLKDTSVFTWVNKNFEIHPFEVNGYFKNSDIAKKK